LGEEVRDQLSMSMLLICETVAHCCSLLDCTFLYCSWSWCSLVYGQIAIKAFCAFFAVLEEGTRIGRPFVI